MLMVGGSPEIYKLLNFIGQLLVPILSIFNVILVASRDFVAMEKQGILQAINKHIQKLLYINTHTTTHHRFKQILYIGNNRNYSNCENFLYFLGALHICRRLTT